MHDELIAALEKATGDSAGLILEAWEHMCRTSVDFRRYACTSVDEYGLTVTGRFCRYVDAGAFVSAALLMVPQGCGWRIWAPAADSLQPHRATVWAARGQPMFAPFDVPECANRQETGREHGVVSPHFHRSAVAA